ncbi:CU044_5270 family protein [Sphaerisporangium fuscum]|uniref:CU044_5270 family protein n=1 Tax=Sphaerisporangium fuscum TaxID=2835868 RepID=UPI002029AE7C|nr:CU044_5270 family protein [Sphaerisporangium fuscum]
MTMLNRLREGVPPQTDLDAERNRLLAEIRGGSGAPAAVRLRPVRPMARLRWGLTLAGALGLAAAVTVTLTRLDGGAGTPAVPRPPATTAAVSAASVLEKAALVAEQTKIVKWRPDQWYYVKQTQDLPINPVWEQWIRMDGSREAVREWHGKLKIGPGEKGPMNPAKTQRRIEDLPSDPDAMLDYFRDDADGMRFGRVICGEQTPCPEGSEKDVEAYAALQWYMEYGPIIPPDKAAVMYRAMAKIPNIQIDENATTMEGRKGIGVVFDAGAAGRIYTILDPGDYHYLGMKTVTADRTFGFSVLASGIVDKPGETP